MTQISKVRIDSGFGLAEALSVDRGDVVSLVGAGGKTTVLYALTTELRRRGLTVVATSTTRMQMPMSATTVPPLVLVEREDNWLKTVKSRLARYGSVTVVRDRLRGDKLVGIDPVMVDPLRSLADTVVIEADGARGRSLKAPAEHEPVIPEESTVSLVLAGLDVLGRPLDEQNVHRFEIVSLLSRARPSEPIAEDIVVEALAGYLPKLPKNGRTIVFLNKVTDELARAAESIGEGLLRRGVPEVVFGEAKRAHGCFYRMTAARSE